MGRGKGAHFRRDTSNPDAPVNRRPLMEPIPPPVPLRRPSPFSPVSSASPPPSPSSKRPRPSGPIPRFLYAPSRHLDVSLLLPPTSSLTQREVDVLVPAQFFVTSNPGLISRQVWGGQHGLYTDDSDVVAMLAHSGRSTPPNSPVLNLEHVRARILVFRPQAEGKPMPNFLASHSGGIASRAWPGDKYDGACMLIQDVEFLYLGDEKRSIPKREQVKLVAEVPGLVPVGVGGVPKRKRDAATRESVYVMFDLCNDPCKRYDPGVMEGLASNVEKRLEIEVLYVENDIERFEVARVGNGEIRFAKVKKQVLERLLIEGVVSKVEKCKFPLEEEDIEAIETLPWRKLFWGPDGVTVKGKHYRLTKMMFRERKS